MPIAFTLAFEQSVNQSRKTNAPITMDVDGRIIHVTAQSQEADAKEILYLQAIRRELGLPNVPQTIAPDSYIAVPYKIGSVRALFQTCMATAARTGKIVTLEMPRHGKIVPIHASDEAAPLLMASGNRTLRTQNWPKARQTFAALRLKGM